MEVMITDIDGEECNIEIKSIGGKSCKQVSLHQLVFYWLSRESLSYEAEIQINSVGLVLRWCLATFLFIQLS